MWKKNIYWKWQRNRTFNNVQSQQEAQLSQRDSASAAHVFLGSLTDRALHWTLHLLYGTTI